MAVRFHYEQFNKSIVMNILSFEQEWMRQKSGRIQIIRFMREAIGVSEVSWQDLTKINLIRVADYIKDRVSPNSARTYFAEIVAFLHCYDDEGIIPCKNPSEVLKCKKVPQQNTALTEDELHLIVAYYDSLWLKKGHQAEKDVLTLFLIEAITGARSCDVEEISTNNIENHLLSYVSKKTKTLAVIPEHCRLQQLISRKPTAVYSATTKNRTIKRVAKVVGITQPITLYYHGAMVTKPKNEFLGTHSARRTFASILSAKGVPIAEIAQFMSHNSTQMTERYIKVDSQNVSEAAMSFFNG